MDIQNIPQRVHVTVIFLLSCLKACDLESPQSDCRDLNTLFITYASSERDFTAWFSAPNGYFSVTET